MAKESYRDRFKKFEPSQETKSEIKTLRFWQGILAEFVAMVILVMVGCGAWVNNAETEDKAIEELNKSLPTVRIAISFGFTYAVLIYCLWDISGGHINPSVTLATLVCRKIHPLRGILFILVHIFGAILGAALLHGLTPGVHSGNLGCTVPQEGVSPEKAFGVEFFVTMFLVFAFFAAAEKRKENPERANLAPFIICFVIIAMHLFAVPYTGASMNTARSFGPAVVMAIFKHHWVYWFGPFVGGCIGGVLYDTCFSSGANVDRQFPRPPKFSRKAKEGDAEAGEGSARKREGEGEDAPPSEREALTEPTDIEEEKKRAQEAAASQP